MSFRQRVPSETDLCSQLYIVRSEADVLKLRMQFLFNKHISHQEKNSLWFVVFLLRSENGGSLAHHLLDKLVSYIK